MNISQHHSMRVRLLSSIMNDRIELLHDSLPTKPKMDRERFMQENKCQLTYSLINGGLNSNHLIFDCEGYTIGVSENPQTGQPTNININGYFSSSSQISTYDGLSKRVESIKKSMVL